MALKNRIERLENASTSNVKIASISYAEGEQTKAEAIAEKAGIGHAGGTQ
jgi:hypothetical protein